MVTDDMPRALTVSVAICTWNRSDMLRQTLARMTQLVVPNSQEWELLIVDNNCTDETSSVIQSFAGRLPIRVLRELAPGLSHARNRALKETRSDLLLWTDDDVLVDEHWLTEFVSAARRFPDAAAFGGVIEPWFLEEPDPDLRAAFPSLAMGFCGLDHERPCGPMPDGTFVFGANMGYRRELIQGMNFDVNLGTSPSSAIGGDEVDFLQQIRSRNGTVVWWPAMRVKHCVAPPRATLAYLKDFSFGKGLEFVASIRSVGEALWLGAPRWLWREWARATVFHLVSCCGRTVLPKWRLRSGPPPVVDASPRICRLILLRERQFLAGMLAGFRQRRSVRS
jgi:hypothetical protein